jgi:hypothetical protein
MPHISQRIESFIALGNAIQQGLKEISEQKNNPLSRVIEQAGIENPWFTKSAVIQSLEAICGWLTEEKLRAWTQPYFLSDPVQVKKVAVIMAGNIPMVNFHDFLSVLICGHRFLGKLSSNDKRLLPFMADWLTELEPGWKGEMEFTESRLDDFDAVIATGTNNTGRYFEYYFGKYPHIIRRNRQSLGVLRGNETVVELGALHHDVFQYYGMGCRNISMFLVPNDYDFKTLFEVWETFPKPTEHNKYLNNYDYYRSFYLVNLQPFYDTGYVSVLEDDRLASPVSVLHYKRYTHEQELMNFMNERLDQIQCVVAAQPIQGLSTVLPGQAQSPGLTDYPDGVDIIQFLLAL